MLILLKSLFRRNFSVFSVFGVTKPSELFDSQFWPKKKLKPSVFFIGHMFFQMTQRVHQQKKNVYKQGCQINQNKTLDSIKKPLLN